MCALKYLVFVLYIEVVGRRYLLIYFRGFVRYVRIIIDMLKNLKVLFNCNSVNFVSKLMFARLKCFDVFVLYTRTVKIVFFENSII